MLAAIPQPLEVHQVGGDDTVSTLISVLGPALAAVAAIIAAVLAARFAKARQKEQLNQDWLSRSVENIRDAIDYAVGVVHEGTKAGGGLTTAVPNWEVNKPRLEAIRDDPKQPDPVREEAQSDLDSTFRQVNGYHGDLIDAVTDLVGASVRLSLRLGRNHPIVQQTKSLQAGWEGLVASYLPGLTGVRTADQVAEGETAEAISDDAYEGFHHACENWLTLPREALLYPAQ